MQDKFRATGKEPYFHFVDLEKAFDRVTREVIRWAMGKFVVEDWLVLAVVSMYTGAKTVVVPSYTVWRQRHMGVNNLHKIVTEQHSSRKSNSKLLGRKLNTLTLDYRYYWYTLTTTPCSKKSGTLCIFSITFSNVDRFE